MSDQQYCKECENQADCSRMGFCARDANEVNKILHDSHPWTLNWANVKTVSDIKLLMRIVLVAQYGSDAVKVSDDLAQQITDEDQGSFTRIFNHE